MSPTLDADTAPPKPLKSRCQLVPGTELAIFEDSGHSPHIEERAAFTRRRLAAFWSQRP
jgi:pimeloyl-ACP methyl ester carboxylesterase